MTGVSTGVKPECLAALVIKPSWVALEVKSSMFAMLRLWAGEPGCASCCERAPPFPMIF